MVVVAQRIILVSLFLLTGSALAANIELQTDRTIVQQDESLTLVFTSDSEPDGNPEFSPLRKDFQILNTNQSSSIQVINGQMSQQFTWQVMVMPKRSGRLTIPPIAFGRDKSRALTVTVKAAGPSAQSNKTEFLFLEASADKDEAYVQSQIIFSVRIYRALDLVKASLSELTLNDPDAVIEQLTDNKTYEKIINGNRYIVFEKQYAVFPQAVGTLKIEPMEFLAQYRDARRNLRSKRMSSKPVTVKIKPVPAQIRQSGIDYWLPASDLKLTEKWSSNIKEVNVGEPVTRTLSLMASGLMASQLPELNRVQNSSTVKSYVDQPILNNRASSRGMQGVREEKIAYVPSMPGQLAMPGVEIVWWNTKTDKMEVAKLPKRTIKAVGDANTTYPQGTEQPQVPQDPSAEIADLNAMASPGSVDKRWFWASGVLGTLWVLTLFSWWLSSRKARTVQLEQAEDDGLQQVNAKIALQKLKTACENNDHQKAKDSLIQWGRHQWPDRPPTSVGHVAHNVNGVLAKELNRLNDVLYNPKGSNWNGDPLWLAMKLFVQQDTTKQKSEAESIKPLYKLAVDEPEQSKQKV